MNQPQLPPPGWYPDPAGPGTRYWDGARWTEHTQALPGQGAPAQAPATPAQNPYAGGAPGVVPGQPAQPYGYPQATPAATAAATSPGDFFTSFVERLKRLDGPAVAVVGAVVFLLSSFLPWVTAKSLVPGATGTDTSNAWSDEAPWLIRGFSVSDFVAAAQRNSLPSGGSDMILLGPLAVAAAVIAVMLMQGKPIKYGLEIIAGLGALLAVLLVAEIFHIGSWTDDLNDQGFGEIIDASATWGMYVAVLAAGAIVFGAVRSIMAAKKP